MSLTAWSRSREDVLVDQPQNQRPFVPPYGDEWIRHHTAAFSCGDHCEIMAHKAMHRTRLDGPRPYDSIGHRRTDTY